MLKGVKEMVVGEGGGGGHGAVVLYYVIGNCESKYKY